jgi:hypothetical protein
MIDDDDDSSVSSALRTKEMAICRSFYGGRAGESKEADNMSIIAMNGMSRESQVKVSCFTGCPATPGGTLVVCRCPVLDSCRDDPVLFGVLSTWDFADVGRYFDGPAPGPYVTVYSKVTANN